MLSRYEELMKLFPELDWKNIIKYDDKTMVSSDGTWIISVSGIIEQNGTFKAFAIEKKFTL